MEINDHQGWIGSLQRCKLSQKGYSFPTLRSRLDWCRTIKSMHECKVAIGWNWDASTLKVQTTKDWSIGNSWKRIQFSKTFLWKSQRHSQKHKEISLIKILDVKTYHVHGSSVLCYFQLFVSVSHLSC